MPGMIGEKKDVNTDAEVCNGKTNYWQGIGMQSNR
ncbi:hypothetical protein BWQ96_08811 [Gracilariopsis chorda]|uniref:Uncharacterized protein n=1 Tax=Gracilariopsis chorda TaxID=448386 RepID=A0A2V3IH94_9FLOR|nr:hypothetical protein BWQ96_08811 [Gracilariopsis chorda]|eukprot:PXF41476.1 hypothetical protein BWQ96_08811 [Gracilariopsis chorda]